MKLTVQKVHARAADEIADEGVRRVFEEFLRRAELDDLAFDHDRNLVGEGQCFGLIMGDVDQGERELLVDLP